MSAYVFARNLNTFGAFCLEKGIAMDALPHITQPHGKKICVRWVEQERREFRRDEDLYLQEYLDCLRSKDFSFLLVDGGIIQISVIFEGDNITESRFYYIPCPIRFENNELLRNGDMCPLEDFIIDLPADEVKRRLCLRAPFRFELDPKNAKQGHPVNHVHIGPSTTRIPVALNMCWDSFSRFIFKNFYPNHFRTVETQLKHPVTYRQKSLSSDESYELHFSLQVSS